MLVTERADRPPGRNLVAYVLLLPKAHHWLRGALRAALVLALGAQAVPATVVTLESLAAPLPAPDQTSLGVRAFEVPHGALEEALAAIWQELLGIDHAGLQRPLLRAGRAFLAGRAHGVPGPAKLAGERGHARTVPSAGAAPVRGHCGRAPRRGPGGARSGADPARPDRPSFALAPGRLPRPDPHLPPFMSGCRAQTGRGSVFSELTQHHESSAQRNRHAGS
ncbi:hypothetical protein LP420_13625 [Massilia sp. B-10]|nr:hypothetical protein LP420_13625 [Massilia sp. B-10]